LEAGIEKLGVQTHQVKASPYASAA
jgi:hypothetical protein